MPMASNSDDTLTASSSDPITTGIIWLSPPNSFTLWTRALRNLSPSGDLYTLIAARAAEATTGESAVENIYERATFSKSWINNEGPATTPPWAPRVLERVPTRKTVTPSKRLPGSGPMT